MTIIIILQASFI